MNHSKKGAGSTPETDLRDVLPRLAAIALSLQESADRVGDEEVYALCDAILLLKIWLPGGDDVDASDVSSLAESVEDWRWRIRDGFDESDCRRFAAFQLGSVALMAADREERDSTAAASVVLEQLAEVWNRTG